MCPLLFASEVVEGATANNRSASRQSCPKPIKGRSLGLIGEGVFGIQRTVLNKHKGVPMQSIDSTFGDDVDGTTRASPHSADKPLLTT